MKVTIRIDDITPDMNWDNFNKVMGILDSYKIKPLLGIVPNNQDSTLSLNTTSPDFVNVICALQRRGVTLSMHGATHVYTTKKGGIFPLNHFSEFAGVPIEKQREILTKAKNQMQEWGIDTDIFMAPGHTFDGNTMKVLKELGFRYITDGFGINPFERNGMVFLPIALQKSKAFREKDGITTIVLHVNAWKAKEFEQFEEMLKMHQKDFVSYETWFSKSVDKTTIYRNIYEYLAATGKRILVGLKNGK